MICDSIYPIEPETTKDGSVILWNELYRVPHTAPSMHKSWQNPTKPIVPVICGKCGARFTMSVHNWRSGIRSRALCTSCTHSTRKPTYHNGGTWISSQGYKFIAMSKLPHEEQKLFVSMGTSNSGVAEHRIVVARHLGRPLETYELVHHINGNKTDNRLENLRLVNRQTHLSEERAEIMRLQAILKEHRIPF